MKGEVLQYNDDLGSGQISGADGIRYNFTRADLKQLVPIYKGTQVDFDFEGKQAKDIYVVQPAASTFSAGPQTYTGPVEPDLGLWGYFIRALTAKYADFGGRARRKEFWGYFLFSIIVYVILGLVIAAGAGMVQNGTQSGTTVLWIGVGLIAIFSLATIIPSIALHVRRFHDFGQSGWWVVGIFILDAIVSQAREASFISVIVLIVVGVIGSQAVQNKYGPPPKRIG